MNEELTLEQAQKRILQLETEKEELEKKKETLEKEVNTLTENHKKEIETKDGTIEELKKHNSFLFQRVDQSNNLDNKNDNKKDEKTKEESLADLISILGGNN